MPRRPLAPILGAAPPVAARSPLIACLLLSVASGCDGQIGDPSPFLGGLDGGFVPGDVGVDAGPRPDVDPFAGGGATLGVLCGAMGAEGRFVLTAEAAGCSRHAELFGGAAPTGDIAVAEMPPIERAGRYEASAELCLDGECETVSLNLEVDVLDDGGAIGRWRVPSRGLGGSFAANRCRYDGFLPGRDPALAPNLAIEEIALYQGVKVPLATGLEPAPGNTPIVAGRPGLIRVFVAPQVGFTQNEVTAELRWDRGDGEGLRTRRAALEIAIASREQNRGTTFEFRVEPDDVVEGARYSVALFGENACGGLNQDTSRARFPTSGTAALPSRAVGALDLVLVPFRYMADGSGRLPITSETQVELYRNTLFGMFPVEAVNVSVREPVDLELTVTPAASTWSPVLQRLFEIRAEDNPPPQTYYYGLLRPSEGGWSGVAGLGPLPSAGDVTRRGAIGLGGAGLGAVFTCAHELGHAAGRSHAPCGGAGNPDPSFPYADGSIGVWGYDILTDTLKDPAATNDVMGYCSNRWLSDYNFTAMANRYRFVNGVAAAWAGPPSRWRSVVLQEGGEFWGKEVVYPIPPSGDEVTVVFERDEVALAEDRAVVTELDHSDDLIVFLPAAPEGTTHVRLLGRRIAY